MVGNLLGIPFIAYQCLIMLVFCSHTSNPVGVPDCSLASLDGGGNVTGPPLSQNNASERGKWTKRRISPPESTISLGSLVLSRD